MKSFKAEVTFSSVGLWGRCVLLIFLSAHLLFRAVARVWDMFFIGKLLLGTGIIVVTVVFHVAGLVGLAKVLPRVPLPERIWGLDAKLFGLLLTAVLGVIFVHVVESWIWALVYYGLDEFSDMETALYFSVVTSTTLGYGDLMLSAKWRILSTFEAMGGLILFGASTGFLMALVKRLIDRDQSEVK